MEKTQNTGLGTSPRKPPVPSFIKSVELDSGSLGIALEDVGEISLEEVLYKSNKNRKIALAKGGLNILVYLHNKFTYNPLDFNYTRVKEDFAEEIVKNFRDLILARRPNLYNNWFAERRSFKQTIAPIIKELDRESRYIIHGDYTPANIVINKDKKMIAVDLGHVTVAPWQFDVVSFLKHPSFNLGDEEVYGLLEYFVIEKTNSSLKSTLHITESSIKSFKNLDEKYVSDILKVFYLSNIFNDFRALGFSSRYEDKLNKGIEPSEKDETWYIYDLYHVLNHDGRLSLLNDVEINSVNTLMEFCQRYGFFEKKE